MTKNKKSIPTCSTGTTSTTKEKTHNSDQFVPTIKIRDKKKTNNNENMFKIPKVYGAHSTISINI